MEHESQTSEKVGNDFLGTGGGPGTENYSPFRPPNEEQVFITREAEKQKKKEEKEAAKHLKIWDKKTATSRMPLKRVKDGDIKAQSNEGEHVYNFNSHQRGYISSAMQIAKSRVQFPRESRPQNINEFVDQKKEMFLVELSYNTIKEEIRDLDMKKNRKGEALKESSTQLDKDSAKLIQFIDSDNISTQDRQKEADAAMAERKIAENNIKKLEGKIQQVKSDIDKNNDLLTGYEEHKSFLFSIFQKENPQWCREQLQIKQEKLDKIKKRWIEMSKLHKDSMGDDDIFMQELVKSQGETGATKSGSQGKQKQMTEADWDKRFDDLLQLDLIELEENFYEEEMLFEQPERLMDVFSQLEEQNLSNISKTQEIEEQLEKMKQKEVKKHREIGGELEQQQAVKQDLENQILIAKMTLQELQKQSRATSISATAAAGAGSKKNKAGEEDQELNIHQLMEDIKNDILDVYEISQSSKDGPTTEGKQTIEILKDIEVQMEDHMKFLTYVVEYQDSKFKDKVKRAETKMKEKRTNDLKQLREKQNRENLEKLQEEMKARMNRVVKKIGKKDMHRSEKDKQQEKKVERTIDPETQDQLYYLGLNLKELPEIAQGAE